MWFSLDVIFCSGARAKHRTGIKKFGADEQALSWPTEKVLRLRLRLASQIITRSPDVQAGLLSLHAFHCHVQRFQQRAVQRPCVFFKWMFFKNENLKNIFRRTYLSKTTARYLISAFLWVCAWWPFHEVIISLKVLFVSANSVLDTVVAKNWRVYFFTHSDNIFYCLDFAALKKNRLIIHTPPSCWECRCIWLSRFFDV